MMIYRVCQTGSPVAFFKNDFMLFISRRIDEDKHSNSLQLGNSFHENGIWACVNVYLFEKTGLQTPFCLMKATKLLFALSGK